MDERDAGELERAASGGSAWEVRGGGSWLFEDLRAKNSTLRSSSINAGQDSKKDSRTGPGCSSRSGGANEATGRKGEDVENNLRGVKKRVEKEEKELEKAKQSWRERNEQEAG